MSCNYAESLSDYPDKGICGLPEQFDTDEILDTKIEQLAKLMQQSKHIVFHTGAGISTSAGIPDFRGPKGVWTLQDKGEKPEGNISFCDAVPTFTHMSLVALANQNYLHYCVNQNVDGLSIRSGFPIEKLSELHGNMFVDKCQLCEKLYVRNTPSETVGQKCSGVPCPNRKPNGRICRGRLIDTILDWEGNLPYGDLKLADEHSSEADLSICLGTTLQIVPSGKLPMRTKKNGGKIVICNLQKTKYDAQAVLVIRGYVDVVMKKLVKLLAVEVPPYTVTDDPTKVMDRVIELKRITPKGFKKRLKKEDNGTLGLTSEDLTNVKKIKTE